MTESVFHHLTLYSLSSFGDTLLPYKVMLGIPTPYKEVLHWMTVAKGDSHQTNPWAVCAHWLRGQTLVCDIRRKYEYSRWALGA